MTENEFNDKLATLSLEYQRQKNALETEYALSNMQIKVGDIVTDHIGSIIVESIHVESSRTSPLPYCIFKGLELTKKGIPTKKRSKRHVWSNDIIK